MQKRKKQLSPGDIFARMALAAARTYIALNKSNERSQVSGKKTPLKPKKKLTAFVECKRCHVWHESDKPCDCPPQKMLK